jgi:hypothetical protein
MMWGALHRSMKLQLGRRTLASEPFLPRVTSRRLEESGPGGRSSIAGVKVAIFGATGFLGKHVCNQLGMFESFLLNTFYFSVVNQARTFL